MDRKERMKTKARVIEIYGGQCANWEDPRFDHLPDKKLTLHHIIFKSEDGPTEKSNLIPLCKNCHEFLHKKVEEMNERKRTD